MVVRAGLHDVSSTWARTSADSLQTSRNGRRGANQMMPRVADCGVRSCQGTSIGSLHTTTHHKVWKSKAEEESSASRALRAAVLTIFWNLAFEKKHQRKREHYRSGL